MQYTAIITKEERINKRFWKYKFLDVKTNKIVCFYHSKKINYVPNLAGNLELAENDEQEHKLYYQDYKQEVANPKETNEEEALTHLEEKTEKDNEKSDLNFTRRPIKLTFPQLIKFINELHESGMTWKEIARRFNRTTRMIRYWRKLANQPLKKVGRKKKIQGSDLTLLVALFLVRSLSLFKV